VVIADKTVKAKRRSFDDLLVWARGLDGERVWAIEDCRHVCGALERFLLKRGEQVVRVAPKLAAGARSSARERGKSDVIDAGAIARAALREGLRDAVERGVELSVAAAVQSVPAAGLSGSAGDRCCSAEAREGAGVAEAANVSGLGDDRGGKVAADAADVLQ
jgi:hypothetical protein